MSTSDTVREVILQRIRAALHDVPSTEQPENVAVARDYRTIGSPVREEVVEEFIERVTDYKVLVQRVEEASLSQAIEAACAARGVQSLVIPEDLPESWLPPHIEWLLDANTLSNEQLDESDGVLTGCALGIAETGTIVLNGGAYQGRRAITLLPDYHLCVVFENQIVDLVPEAIVQLRDAVLTQRRPITFISGPSATSDIELNRVEGVHGPRTLHVLVVHNISHDEENR
jgi:L-lactate dehydrogenase complex protein LldG